MSSDPQHKHSLSPKEAILLEALRSEPHPHSAYDLIEKLRDHGLKAPPTVYRALNKLLELGYVHRLESLNAYVACTHDCGGGHANAAFAICDDCGGVEEILEPKVTGSARSWAKKNDFSLRSVTFELRGQCRSCREGSQSSR